MVNKIHTKYILIALVALSLFSFAYVNLHAAYSQKAVCKEQIKAPQPVMLEDENDQEDHNLPVPDVTVLNRVVEIVQQLTRANN